MIEALRQILWPKGHRLDIWAIVDAAQDQQVYWTLTNSFLPHCCLFAGALPPALEMAAPYLVQLDPDDKFTEYLAKNLSRNLAIFLQCDASLPEVRRHLRSFLTVKDISGRKMLFRYYDPRVLRVYLPTCSFQELQTVFGPLHTFWAIADNARELTQFGFRGKSLQVNTQPLHPEAGTPQSEDSGPVIVLTQTVLAIQRGGDRQRVPILLQGAGRGGVLRRSSAAIRFFRSVSAPEELPFRDAAYSIPVSSLDPDVTIYAEAASPGDVTLTLELTAGGRTEATIQSVRIALDGGAAAIYVGTSVQTRRRLDVLPVEPAACRGRLTLRSGPTGPAVTLFDGRDSERGFPLRDGFSFDTPHTLLSFWLEGEAPSGTQDDGDLRLSIEGSSLTGDRVRVTVAELDVPTTVIPGVPPRTQRLAAASPQIQLQTGDLVLVSGAGEASFRTTSAPPDVPLQWEVSRLGDDAAAVVALSANPLPVLQAEPGGAVMQSNAAGTFVIQAAVQGSDDWGGPRTSVRVTLVHAALAENRSTVNGRFCQCGRVAGSDVFRLHGGLEAPVQLHALVTLTGGGPDGMRGVEAIRGGWITNVIGDNTGARYRGGVARQHVYRYRKGEDQVLVNFEEGPLLESTPEGIAAQGALLAAERQFAPGASWKVQDGGPIEQIWSYQEFRSCLALWSTHAAGQIGVLLQTGWMFTGDYACTPLKVLRTIVPVRLAATGTVAYPALVQGRETELEMYPPTAGQREME